MSAQDVVILAGIALVVAGVLGAIAQTRIERERAKVARWRRYQAHVDAIDARRAARHDD